MAERGARTTVQEVQDADAEYKHVLIPTDGSEGARRGVQRGIDIGNQHGSTIHMLHVVDERREAETPALSSEELVLEKLEERAMELLDEVADDARERGLDAVVECCRGVPHDEILAYADANDIDLVVMGVHGDGSRGRPHVGSTTQRVLESSKVPVLPV